MIESLDSPDSLLAGFVFGKESGQLVIITGPSGCGKTSWCRALVQAAGTRDITACGLVSPAIFVGGVKVSIGLRDVQSGEQHQLATRRSKISPGRVTEGWSMDEQTLKWGNERLAPAPAGCLFILDELGPLELKHGVGLMNGMGLISDRHYPLACVVIRPALLSQALELWPWGQILHIPLEELPAENGH